MVLQEPSMWHWKSLIGLHKIPKMHTEANSMKMMGIKFGHLEFALLNFGVNCGKQQTTKQQQDRTCVHVYAPKSPQLMDATSQQLVPSLLTTSMGLSLINGGGGGGGQSREQRWLTLVLNVHSGQGSELRVRTYVTCLHCTWPFGWVKGQPYKASAL